ncbi:MAG: DUF3788 domain-containing protein [Firmicutes bacterium]|nr:DUF3788 domain-containing protein [Bacillota bacterium]
MKHEELQLRDAGAMPSDEVLREVLGESYVAYVRFQEGLTDFEIEQEWQWYTPYKAWFARGQYRWTTPRGTKKEKTIFWVCFFKGYFNVAVWFKEKNRMELLKAEVDEETKQKIRATETMGQVPTFPIQFDVHSAEQLADIYTLIKWKKELEA